ncbi:MAG TPA: hypothetical protein VFV38_34955 [Ktedonobacteraceae bacterium]|nr:hypothetical protein [Ktedonobacteraceae bacterium]
MHWWIGFWPLFPLLWIGLIIWLFYSAGRWFGWRGRRVPFDRPFEPNALEILRQRYARGEIDGTTFDQMYEYLRRSGARR